jgi:hypothetical protein
MKFILLSLCILQIAACHPKPQVTQVCTHDQCKLTIDSLQSDNDDIRNQLLEGYSSVTWMADSLAAENNKLYLVIDSLSTNTDSLKTKLFVSNYKLERIKFYVRICMRSPSQKTFLLGWVRRVTEL